MPLAFDGFMTLLQPATLSCFFPRLSSVTYCVACSPEPCIQELRCSEGFAHAFTSHLRCVAVRDLKCWVLLLLQPPGAALPASE
jgi:hypothetical protein